MVVVTGSGFPLISGFESNPRANRSGNSRGPQERPDRQHTERNDESAGLDHQSASYVYFIAALRADSATNTPDNEKARTSESFATEFDKQLRDLNDQISSYDVTTESSSNLSVNELNIQSANGIDAFAASVDFQYHAGITANLQRDDGTAISINAQIDVSVHIDIASISAHNSQPDANQSDPLALDTDGDGQISLTDERTGPAFDINADGRVDRTSFVTGGDVFLALDRNGDGIISDGGELFGDQRGAATGFLELARFDQNGDGQINRADSIFDQLRGVRLESGQLRQHSLEELGVASISLNNQQVNRPLEFGNTLAQQGTYQTNTGETRLAADLYLRYRSLSPSA